jgi:hypothetical protein
MKPLYIQGLGGLIAMLGLLLQQPSARAGMIFVANQNSGTIGAGTIGAYTTSGATVNAALR